VAEKDESAGQPSDSARPDPLAGFVEFYREKYPKLVVAVMAVGAPLDDARDAVNEVMEEILVKNRWTSLSHPFPWIRTAALRTYYDKCTRDRRGLILAAEGGHLVAEEYRDARLNIWEDTQWVQQMLDTLSPAQREVMIHILSEFTPAEIAEMLGKNAATVRQNVLLAKRRLQRLLSPDYQISLTSDAKTTRKEDS
jgi:RNA polymerase sigma factor (sigma-70 family)